MKLVVSVVGFIVTQTLLYANMLSLRHRCTTATELFSFQRTIPNSGFSKGNSGPSANDTMAVQKEVSCRDMHQVSNPMYDRISYYISQLCYFHERKSGAFRVTKL